MPSVSLWYHNSDQVPNAKPKVFLRDNQQNMFSTYLLTLLRILCLSILAIRAPVAVVYDGGGVYLGGASSIGAGMSNGIVVIPCVCV